MSCVYIYTFLKRARDLPVTIEDKRGEVKHLQSVLKANDDHDSFFFFTENGSDIGGPQQQSGSQQQPKIFVFYLLCEVCHEELAEC